MPDLPLHLTKLGFTAEENRLAVTIEKIIFRINRQVHHTAPERGVSDDELKSELSLINIRSNDNLFQRTLEKCQANQILARVGGKWYSTTYFS